VNTTFRAQCDNLKIEDQIKDRKYYKEITETGTFLSAPMAALAQSLNSNVEHTTFVYNEPSTGPLVAVMTTVNPKTNPNEKSKVLLRTKSVRIPFTLKWAGYF